jgi:hypothetical protein
VADRPERPDWTALRRAARHTAETWALEAAQQRRLATEYRDHLAWMAGELRGLQRHSGTEEHSCPTCDKVAASMAAEPEGGTA